MPSAPLTAAYTAFTEIRAVGPPDVPFEGRLARSPGGETVLLVDRELLADWTGCTFAPDGHVLAPLDVLRRRDGHDMVLPALAGRVDRVLARRAAAHVPPTAGETVTLAVSAIRGVAAAGAAGVWDARAEWWLTTDGKPVLVCDSGERSLVLSSADLLAHLADSGPPGLAGTVREAGSALEAPRSFLREVPRLEEGLFALADAEPLTVDVLTPARVQLPATPERLAPPPEPSSGSWWHRLAGASDGTLASLAGEVRERMRRRGPRERTRIRPLWLAAGAAAIVIGVGLAWPEGEDRAARAAGAHTPSAGAAAPASSVPPQPTTPAGTPSPVDALAELLAARRTCADDGCRAATQESADTVLPGGAHTATEPALTLLDDFGGLAVIRVEADGVSAQFVTVVTTENGWRIRDVFDAADPPAG